MTCGPEVALNNCKTVHCDTEIHSHFNNVFLIYSAQKVFYEHKQNS